MNIGGLFFTSKYKLGDRVIHVSTRRYGNVIETQQVGKTQLISARLDNGTEASLLDRREFQLASRG